MDPGPDVGVYSSFMIFLKQKYYTKNQEWSYVLCIDWMSQISIYVSKSGYCRNYFFLQIARQDDKINIEIYFLFLY